MKRIRFESKFIIGTLFVLTLLTISLTTFFSYKLHQSFTQSTKLQDKRTHSIVLADELRQSSDDLTNFARMYAVTEDPRYKLVYNRIIDIRNGDEIRPPGYQEIYWDLEVLNTNGVNLFTVCVDEHGNELGRKVSIEQLMHEMEMDETELSYMHQSKIQSDSLALIEMEVFNIIETSTDWKQKIAARERLFDNNYLRLKSKIMKPIKEFYVHVDKRTHAELDFEAKQSKWYIFVVVILTAVTLVFVSLMRFTIYLSRLSNRKIERKRQYLESILDSSCLVSRADRFGKITLVNDKFCKVSGYRESELIGQDHSILNSGYHSRKFWTNMYKTVVVDKGIWHNIVTNRNRKGDEYIVDSYIMATFDERGAHDGYISVRQDITELMNSLQEVDKKNVYLEHAAKILRHDMHSGINTYIPRGISSMERRLEKIQKSIDPKSIYKEWRQLEAPMKLLKEGIHHAQRVYSGVKEFTNLVKKDANMYKETYDLHVILDNHLRGTAYRSQVQIDDLGVEDVNESLFCTAVDNLIRNGLRYNDSDTKLVKLYRQDNVLVVEDNGRGMSQKEFEELAKPYTRKSGQKETGSGLGLNICVAIMQEHGFEVTCEKIQTGTKLKIKVR